MVLAMAADTEHGKNKYAMTSPCNVSSISTRKEEEVVGGSMEVASCGREDLCQSRAQSIKPDNRDSLRT